MFNSFVARLFYSCINIISSLYQHCSILVHTLFYLCTYIVPSLYLHCFIPVQTLFYPCTNIVLSLYLYCFISVPTLFYLCIYIFLSLCQHCSSRQCLMHKQYIPNWSQYLCLQTQVLLIDRKGPSKALNICRIIFGHPKTVLVDELL